MHRVHVLLAKIIYLEIETFDLVRHHRVGRCISSHHRQLQVFQLASFRFCRFNENSLLLESVRYFDDVNEPEWMLFFSLPEQHLLRCNKLLSCDSFTCIVQLLVFGETREFNVNSELCNHVACLDGHHCIVSATHTQMKFPRFIEWQKNVPSTCWYDGHGQR